MTTQTTVRGLADDPERRILERNLAAMTSKRVVVSVADALQARTVKAAERALLFGHFDRLLSSKTGREASYLSEGDPWTGVQGDVAPSHSMNASNDEPTGPVASSYLR